MKQACRSWTSRRRYAPPPKGRPALPLPSAWVCTATWTAHLPRCKPRGRNTASDVPDVLAPGLRCVFCGINPGRVSAAAAAHFANPRNDFWRLLHDARLHAAALRPAGAVRAARARLRRHERRLPHDARLGRPAARRLRRRPARADRARAAARARSRSSARRPTAARSASGPSSARRCARSATTALFVLPSTSPANAAVPYAERLRWFGALHELARADRARRPCARSSSTRRSGCCSMRWQQRRAATPGGSRRAAASTPGESDEAALRRELDEEAGLRPAELGPVVWRREHVLPFGGRLVRQRERFHLVRVDAPRARADDRPR